MYVQDQFSPYKSPIKLWKALLRDMRPEFVENCYPLYCQFY